MMNLQRGDSAHSRNSVFGSHSSLHDAHSITSAEFVARLESYESSGKKNISDVRRTFCLFSTFDFLFVTLLWIIELNVSCSPHFIYVVFMYSYVRTGGTARNYGIAGKMYSSRNTTYEGSMDQRTGEYLSNF